MSLDALLTFAPALPGMPRTFVEWCEWVGFTPTEGQRALLRVAVDGHDPETELERTIFGGAFHVSDTARREQVWRLGRRSAKTTLLALLGVYRMVTGDLAGVGRGDRPMVAIIAQDKSFSGETVVKALNFVNGHPALKAMLRNPKVGSFTMVRPDGREVRFVTKVSNAGGKSARGHWWLLFVIDEAEFLDPSKPDAVANVGKTVAAARPAILSGGSIVMASTPWPADSYPKQVFTANYSHPVHALCALAPTLLMRDGDPELRAHRDAAMSVDPDEARREYDCEETDVTGAFFEASTIDAAVSATTPRARKHRVSASIDLAFIKDNAGSVHVERQIVGAKVMLVVTAVDLTEPRKDPEARKPNVVVSRFVAAARDAGAQAIVADGHYAQLVREHAANPDVAMQVVAAPTAPKDQSAAELYLRDLFREGLVQLPNRPELIGQLKSVLAKAMPGGLMRAIPPRRAGVGHCDLFKCLCNAAWYDRRHGHLLRGTVIATSLAPGFGTSPSGYDTDGWT